MTIKIVQNLSTCDMIQSLDREIEKKSMRHVAFTI